MTITLAIGVQRNAIIDCLPIVEPFKGATQ